MLAVQNLIRETRNHVLGHKCEAWRKKVKYEIDWVTGQVWVKGSTANELFALGSSRLKY